MTVPLVTVIIPTFNWSSVLPYSIGSALEQSIPDIEVLVVGDGCTDDSAQVVAGIGDDRVRWNNLPENSGHQSAANNEGLRLARGEFIAYLGHDDLWLPHHLESLLEVMRTGADVAYGMTRFVHPIGFDYFRLRITPAQFVPGMWIPPSSVMHRRSIVDAVGGWKDYRRLKCDPETDLLARMHAAGFAVASAERLTVIKFPAAFRRDVYRLRPSHEQAAWAERIKHEGTFEIKELVAMFREYQGHLSQRCEHMTYWQLWITLYHRTKSGIMRRVRRLVQDGSSEDGSSEIDRRRRYKGLDRGP